MALVCDIESTPAAATAPEEPAATQEPDNDLEDGEIEDDGEDDVPAEALAAPAAAPKENESAIAATNNVMAVLPPPPVAVKESKIDRDRSRHDRSERRRHEEKKKHMTEAEKSILHLRKRERMQREKWEKYRKEQNMEPTDDFAINIEKAIASVLKKDKHNISDEEKDEEKRGRKRKNRDKDRLKGGKQRKLDSPKSEDMDENEFLNVRGGSPNGKSDDKKERSPSSARSDDSYDSEYSSDRSKSEDRRDRKREYKRNKARNRDRNRKKSRERRGAEPTQQQFKDAQGVCVFFLQGKCQKNDCPYSHEAVPPMKLELCKFYLKDCCAKGEKCSYMHSEFPCKFYHTGLVCLQGDNCKFAHGRPLDEHRKQILFKHIETAPREILGGFPRMSREEALNKINVAQQNLLQLYGGGEKNKDDKGLIPSLFEINVPVPSELNSDDATKQPKPEKPPRNRPSRWQDPDPVADPQPPQTAATPFPFPAYGHHVVTMGDQDMRVNSNGDIDMRTLPPLAQIAPPPQTLQPSGSDETSAAAAVDHDATNFTQDIDIRNPNMLQFDTKDVDIRPRLLPPPPIKDVDIRTIPPVFVKQQDQVGDDDDDEESQLLIDTGEEEGVGTLPNLPEMQRELYMRIQSQQKTNLPEAEELEGGKDKVGQQHDPLEVSEENINWYSDDDDEDENRLTIKVDNDEIMGGGEKRGVTTTDGEGENSNNIMSPPPQSQQQVKPQEVVEKLGDLSKIDISAEVTKLLTSISQTATAPTAAPKINRDPRQQRSGSNNSGGETKISIYEQGSIPDCTPTTAATTTTEEVELRAGRPDVDLRNLQLPFKGMLNYTPAKEIDASVNSHPPMPWRVVVVEVPRPDYTGLKLNVQEAEKTGDPRLKKIFRLGVGNTAEEKVDSPMSPKASPKASTTTATRIDPRLKKIEEKNQLQQEGVLTYTQQLNILQSSAFFQSLTSNQKLLLNQELALRNDPNGYHDPVLNSVLSTLNLIPTQQSNSGGGNMGAALSILAKLNPAVGGGPPMVLRQNPNLMNQMVQPGLLGAAPGIPNLPQEFQMGGGGFPPQDPRGVPPFGNFPPPPQEGFGGGGFDDYYPPQQEGFGHRGDGGRSFNRDRRRGRNFNRSGGNRNFRNRNNRNNRSHTPP